jgi:hypothetical protein
MVDATDVLAGRRWGLFSTLGVALALVAGFALASVAAPGEASQTERVPIECGGYDADGNLVNPEAAEIEYAEVGPDGLLIIPPACGGYTEDGVYIGDD